jgi:hypothetical protein
VADHDAAGQRGAADVLGLGVDDVAVLPRRLDRQPGVPERSAERDAVGRPDQRPGAGQQLRARALRDDAPVADDTSRSAITSTSRSRWEESSTVPPRSATSRSRARIQRMPSGSSPLAGSSRISTCGSPSRA